MVLFYFQFIAKLFEGFLNVPKFPAHEFSKAIVLLVLPSERTVLTTPEVIEMTRDESCDGHVTVNVSATDKAELSVVG